MIEKMVQPEKDKRFADIRQIEDTAIKILNKEYIIDPEQVVQEFIKHKKIPVILDNNIKKPFPFSFKTLIVSVVIISIIGIAIYNNFFDNEKLVVEKEQVNTERDEIKIIGENYQDQVDPIDKKEEVELNENRIVKKNNTINRKSKKQKNYVVKSKKINSNNFKKEEKKKNKNEIKKKDEKNKNIQQLFQQKKYEACINILQKKDRTEEENLIYMGSLLYLNNLKELEKIIFTANKQDGYYLFLRGLYSFKNGNYKDAEVMFPRSLISKSFLKIDYSVEARYYNTMVKIKKCKKDPNPEKIQQMKTAVNKFITKYTNTHPDQCQEIKKLIYKPLAKATSK
jgi:hypothetical protein